MYRGFPPTVTTIGDNSEREQQNLISLVSLTEWLDHDPRFNAKDPAVNSSVKHFLSLQDQPHA